MPGSNKENSSNQPSLDELITLSEAAGISGLSHSHLRLLVRNGDVWGKKVGYFWFTTEKAVREYIARDHRPGPKPNEKP
jgi:hypothetical protein